MRKLFTLLALGLMTVFSAQSVFAENTVYTSYNSSTKTLTYYYDDHYGYSDRPNSVLFQPTSDIARWADYHDEVTKVVIDASMANAELTSLRRMFNGGGSNYLSNVTSITGMSNLKTATVTSMESMFYGCEKLTSIDVSGFNTANVTLMDFMFYDCSSLTSLDLSNFNTAKVTDMRYMFHSCSSLKSLNISSFNTAKVARMQYMFTNCSNLTSLDLMKFRFDALINTSYMFAGCSKLVTIYCGANLTEKSELTYANSVDMFKGCTSIMGGGRTPYDYYSDSNKDKWGAHPDKGGDVYGYFTIKKVLHADMSIDGTVMYLYYDEDPKYANLDWNPDGPGTTNMTTAAKEKITSVSINSSVANALPTSCRRWFYGLKNLKSITGLNYLNTSEVTDMRAMFSLCNSLESLDVSKFNTAKVTDMFDMFNQCNKLTSLNVSNFNTSNVTNMGYMFYGCEKVTSIDVSNFNTSNVKNMGYMFCVCRKVQHLNVANFNTEKVTDMKYMFSGCNDLIDIDLRKFNTEKVTSMLSMFNSCSTLEVVHLLSDLSKVTNTDNMFKNCTNLKTIKCDFDFNASSALTSSTDMFDGCTSLKGDKNTTYSASNPKDKTYAHPDHGTAEPGYFTPFKRIYTLRAGTNALIYRYDTDFDPTNTNMEEYDPKANTERWASYHDAITTVSIGSNMQDAPLTSLRSMFYGGGSNYLSNLTTIQNMGNLNTENVTDMSEMFRGCSKLPSLDLSGFNTAKVTDMKYMFDNCSTLTTLDLSNFNTEKVTDMSNMFSKCKALNSLDISSFNTANVTNMKSMFSECNALTTLDVSKFNTANVTNMAYMFDECHVLTSLNLDRFITSKVTSMAYMFYNCKALKTLDLKIFDFRKVTNTSFMFFGCTNLETIICNSNLNSYSNLTTSTKMFTNCSKLKGGNETAYSESYVDKEYARPDKSGLPGYFTTKDILYAEMSVSGTVMYIRYDANPVDIYHDWDPNGNGTTDMTEEAKNKITEVSISPTVQYARPTSCRRWFRQLKNLKKITGIEYLNTSEVTSMEQMFSDCNALEALDLSKFNTAKVTNMLSMFYNCKKLETLNLLSFNTENVTTMEKMFIYCSALKNLSISSFETDNVTFMNNMFEGCAALTSLDLHSFNAANVTNMSYMFYNSTKLEDISLPDDMSKVTNTSYMFRGCEALKTIECDFDFSASTALSNSTEMFYNCTSLKGGNGTVFHPDYIKKEYARPDHGTNQPGYFTSLKRVYTRWDGSRRTLTYFYGKFNPAESYCEEYDPIAKPGALRWGDYHNNVEKVVIDKSMKDAPLTSMRNMFYGNGSYYLSNVITIEGLENLNTSIVTDMTGMFKLCQKVKSLDLCSFDMTNVISTYEMFNNCAALTTILCNDDWSANASIVSNAYMFTGCEAIVGGNGTTYNSSETDIAYAHVDEAGNPGYFTKSSATGIDNVQSDNVQGTKVLRDGQILILRDGKTYNVMGMEIR